MPRLSDARILMIATDGFEDDELLKPLETLRGRGAEVTLASLETGTITGDKGGTAEAEIAVGEVSADDYDGLLLPGGTKNPDKLRTERAVIDLVKAFDEAGKPLAAICHGPWLLAEADVIRGRTVTSWPSIRTDLRNAGAEVVDEAAAIDGNLVTSRKPDDIPAFVDAFASLVEQADAPAAA